MSVKTLSEMHKASFVENWMLWLKLWKWLLIYEGKIPGDDNITVGYNPKNCNSTDNLKNVFTLSSRAFNSKSKQIHASEYFLKKVNYRILIWFFYLKRPSACLVKHWMF